MAKLTRVFQRIFGDSAPAADGGVAEFGSFASGTPVFSKDVAVIQSLSAWLNGWSDAIVGNDSPAMEDMNAIQYVYARQLAYLFQAGVSEWDAQTTYFIGSFASNGLGVLYYSIQDNNTNHLLTDGAFWSPFGSDVTPTSATIANNQTSAANVSGFLVDQSVNKAFTAEYSLRRTTSAISYADDTAFYANVTPGANNVIRRLVLQPDGKILVSGQFTSFAGVSITRLVRLNANGSMDTAFNTNIGTKFPGPVYGVCVQSDGKILAGGSFAGFNGNGVANLVRLNSDGTEDTAFSINLGTGFDDVVHDVAQQSDTKILVCGTFLNLNGSQFQKYGRLNANGTPDAAFSINVGTLISAGSIPTALAIQADGKGVIGGSVTVGTSFGVIRFNTDGTPDYPYLATIGLGFDSQVQFVIQPDGKIVCSGGFTYFNNKSYGGILRLLPSGLVDSTFNFGGAGFVLSGQTTTNIVQPSGNIIIGGDMSSYNGVSCSGLVRLSKDGVLDTAFGTAVGTINNTVYATLIDSTGKIIFGGDFTSSNGNTRTKIDRMTAPEVAAELIQVSSVPLTGVYNGAAWVLMLGAAGTDDVGVSFTITSGGQLQYTSNELMGSSYAGTMKFLLKGL